MATVDSPANLSDVVRANVQKELDKRGWSRASLSAAIGVNPTRVSQIMNEGRDLRLSVLSKLAHGLGVSPAKLVREGP